MKILHVGKFYPMSGGMERVMFDIVEDFSKKGHRCDLLCAAADKPGVITLNENGKIICTPTLFKVASTMITPAMIRELAKICHDYDIIHVHHPDPMANLALYCSNYKGKVILHWHSDILKQKTLLKFYRPLQNWMIDRADLVIGTSPVYLEESTHLLRAKHKMACLPIGVEQVVAEAEEVKKIRAQYDGKKIVFSLGRLVGYKGHKYLIDAAKYLDDDYVILIGGTGPLFEEMKNQIKENHLENKVVLLGRVSDDELPNYYGACHVFCLSSIWKTEAFGLVQIEAMSCGKPIVATDIKGSGVPWVNLHGYSGLNVPPENPEALASAIQTLLSDSAVYEQFSSQALERYKKFFTKQRMLANCNDIYESLLKGKSCKEIY